MSQESASDESVSNLAVVSAESETGSVSSNTGVSSGTGDEDESKKKSDDQVESKKKPIKAKSTKSQKERIKSQFMKGIEKIQSLKKEQASDAGKGDGSKLKEITLLKSRSLGEKVSIDKSKLRFSQTNLPKSKSKVLYDMKAEESISNLLNRRKTSKPLFRATSFTAKEYVDKGTAQLNQIETDQCVDVKETKPVVGQRISPERMTESLHALVRHLYKNKQTLDVSQISKQDAKSTVKFTLNSFIDEDGGTG